MAYEFPLSLADFFNSFEFTESIFDLDESMSQTGRTGAGEILTASNGVRLWEGEVTFLPNSYADADAIKAKIDLIREPDRPFLVTHAARPAPRKDQNGTILGSAVPKISAIAPNNRDLTIKELPAGYILSPGDPLSFRLGSAPDYRYAYHRLAQGGTANGSGIVTVEVSNYIRPGPAVNDVVTLINPVCKAVYVPGSFDPSVYSGNLVQGIKFGWRQTLR